MLLRYLKGEYTGESTNVDAILERVAPYIELEDAEHIHQIITRGCLSQLDVDEEDTMNTLPVIEKGQKQTFKEHPEVVEKTMNKEEKNIHVSFKQWVIYFSPFLCCTLPCMPEKNGNYCIIFGIGNL